MIPCWIDTPSVPSTWRTPVPFSATATLPLAASAIVIELEFVPEFVLSVKSPVPFVVIVTSENPPIVPDKAKLEAPLAASLFEIIYSKFWLMTKISMKKFWRIL